MGKNLGNKAKFPSQAIKKTPESALSGANGKTPSDVGKVDTQSARLGFPDGVFSRSGCGKGFQGQGGAQEKESSRNKKAKSEYITISALHHAEMGVFGEFRCKKITFFTR